MSVMSANGSTDPSILCEDAARCCGFTTRTADAWIRRGLLPNLGELARTSMQERLNHVLDHLATHGCPWVFESKVYVALPNVQHVPRNLVDGRRRHHFFHRKARDRLPGKPGSPEFMRKLIEIERRLASLAKSDSIVPRRVSPSLQPEAKPTPPGDLKTATRSGPQTRVPSHASVTPNTPLRLSIAAALAYPDGSMTPSGLRREAKRGRLLIERTAGKDYTTLVS